VEGFAQGSLVQFGARRNLIFDQHLTQTVGQLIMQGSGWQAENVGGHKAFCMQKRLPVNSFDPLCWVKTRLTK
jgi:hypothetical protein